MRPSQRQADELRPIKFTRHYTKHAEGSVLVEFGDTKILCNASVTEQVPRFLKGTNQGWLTAEYGMLPRATNFRTDREATRGKQTGRTQEIQRLIGRSLRSAINLKQLGERTITVDCDVLQADGGTRTAAISGACIAVVDALNQLQYSKKLKADPLNYLIASVSVGIYQGEAVLDLDYNEDSNADTDMNIVMNETGQFIELQGTAEKAAMKPEDVTAMLTLAQSGIAQIIEAQKKALA